MGCLDGLTRECGSRFLTTTLMFALVPSCGEALLTLFQKSSQALAAPMEVTFNSSYANSQRQLLTQDVTQGSHKVGLVNQAAGLKPSI